MTDDFIVEEESSNRTFLYAVAGMGGLLVIGLIAIAVIFMVQRGAKANSDIAIMNQTTEAQNALVTLTVAALQTREAPAPSQTPATPTTAPTKIPTFTSTPQSSSPVAQTPLAETPTPEQVVAEVSPTAPAPTPTIATSGGELPPGGLGMLAAIAVAATLAVVIVLARWLRPAI